MTRMDVERLRQSLTAKIEDWWANGDIDRDVLPEVGDDLCALMATAAIAVLEGVADAETYLRKSGMLKEGEE